MLLIIHAFQDITIILTHSFNEELNRLVVVGYSQMMIQLNVGLFTLNFIGGLKRPVESDYIQLMI